MLNRTLGVALLAVVSSASCQPPCHDEAHYHQVDLIEWCWTEPGCLQSEQECPSYTCDPDVVQGGDGFVASFPFDRFETSVPMEALEVTLSFTQDATPNFTLLIRADGTEMCREQVASFVRIVCPISPGARVVTVESSEPLAALCD